MGKRRAQNLLVHVHSPFNITKQHIGASTDSTVLIIPASQNFFTETSRFVESFVCYWKGTHFLHFTFGIKQVLPEEINHLGSLSPSGGLCNMHMCRCLCVCLQQLKPINLLAGGEGGGVKKKKKPNFRLQPVLVNNHFNLLKCNI